MPKFQIILVAKVRAESAEASAELALAAGYHLIETFNDDQSIDVDHGIRAIRGDEACIVPAALLRTLIDAADAGADERERDAEAFRREGDDENRRNSAKDARTWAAAVRQALRIERASLPRKPRARKPAAEARAAA